MAVSEALPADDAAAGKAAATCSSPGKKFLESNIFLVLVAFDKNSTSCRRLKKEK